MIALGIIYSLGLWMVGLGYYHPWYQRAPDIHRSVGVLLLAPMLAHLAWRYWNPRPGTLGSVTERRAAAWMHRYQRPVEIEHESAVLARLLGIQVAAGPVGFIPIGLVAEDDEDLAVAARQDVEGVVALGGAELDGARRGDLVDRVDSRGLRA